MEGMTAVKARQGCTAGGTHEKGCARGAPRVAYHRRKRTKRTKHAEVARAAHSTTRSLMEITSEHCNATYAVTVTAQTNSSLLCFAAT